LIAALFSAMAYLVHGFGSLFLAGMGLVWVSDSMAYVAGRMLGKHKLAPMISPGKTWEGACGGVVSALLYTAVSVPYVLPIPLYSQTYWLTLLGAGLLAVLGIEGDLFESLLKRQAGKKDSGSLLPGHGGVLDRMDALFPVLPFVALFQLLGSYYHVF
jgi:phosphatidate cytidylyltransferase